MFLRMPDPARDRRNGLPRQFALWYGPIIDILQKLSIETEIATPLPHHPSCPNRPRTIDISPVAVIEILEKRYDRAMSAIDPNRIGQFIRLFNRHLARFSEGIAVAIAALLFAARMDPGVKISMVARIAGVKQSSLTNAVRSFMNDVDEAMRRLPRHWILEEYVDY